MIILETNYGDISITLNHEQAPKSAANFEQYVRNGHYDGTLFHRVIPGFMIQGGGFDQDFNQKPTLEPIENEADNGLKNEDYPIFMEKLSTLDHLMMFTSKGNLIYRPVHEIADVKWKETGEHISQTIGLASDEEIVATFAFKSLKEPGHFLIATSDGYIKQTAFADLHKQRQTAQALIALSAISRRYCMPSKCTLPSA